MSASWWFVFMDAFNAKQVYAKLHYMPTWKMLCTALIERKPCSFIDNKKAPGQLVAAALALKLSEINVRPAGRGRRGGAVACPAAGCG
jgi:hypothetical protein